MAALVPEIRRLERPMNLNVTELENGITQIALSGRLDVEGALKIDGEFNQIAEEKKNVLVDLSGVSFIASLGIRTLITGAKATANNGGKMVLLNPQPNVERVLRTSRVDTVIPIIDDESAIKPVFGN
jgi:anti-anti-sigma factor